MISPVDRPWDGVEATGPFLRIGAAAEYLGISVSGYYDKAAKGFVPAPVKLGGKASGVPRPFLDAVISHAATGGVR